MNAKVIVLLVCAALAADGGVRDMRRALLEFCEGGQGASQFVVFYADRGFEVKGENSLAPVDAKLEEAADLRAEAVGLSEILEGMADEKMELKILVLDCCRDNAFATRSWMKKRSLLSCGLAEVQRGGLADGAVLVFSGEPGKAVQDGEGANSPFTTRFLEVLKEGGCDPANSLNRVQADRLRQWTENPQAALDLVLSEDMPWIDQKELRDLANRYPADLAIQLAATYGLTSSGPPPSEMGL